MPVTRRKTPGDTGLTLIELLVTIILIGMLGSIVTAAVVSISGTVRLVDDESTGLADVRKAAERLSRDIRTARGITVSADPSATATSTQLTVWIDANSDYKQQTSETITWKVVAAGSDKFNLVRVVKGGATTVQARSLVVGVAFEYCLANSTSCTAAPTTSDGYSIVKANMTYDSNAGGTSVRQVQFDTRMRNVT